MGKKKEIMFCQNHMPKFGVVFLVVNQGKHSLVTWTKGKPLMAGSKKKKKGKRRKQGKTA